jgi:transglutaminase superfamily protein
MSKLYLTERGHIIPTLCEELTAYRRARKVFQLPPTKCPGILYVLARPYADADQPLHLSVNGKERVVQPDPSGAYRWYEVPVDVASLRAGANTFDFWTDATAMNAWSLAVEPGHAQPESFVSDDGGRTWRNQNMGYLNALRGEYVVRLRLAEGEDPPPQSMAWEDPLNPRLAVLRKTLPPEAHGRGPALERARVLSAWLASSWEHTGPPRAVQYAPWDAETIIAWGKARSGHNAQRPIVMCVHYAVAFVSCCQALGLPARCAALTADLNGWDGHFVAEVWSSEHTKWVMVDPNTDAVFWKAGVPLSITEIQQQGPGLGALIEWGTGTEFQCRFPHMVAFIQENLQKGLCFRHRSIWPRADFLSHPELSPPGHGAVAYCETGLVWEAHDRAHGFGMFSCFADPGYFDAAPAVGSRGG